MELVEVHAIKLLQTSDYYKKEEEEEEEEERRRLMGWQTLYT